MLLRTFRGFLFSMLAVFLLVSNTASAATYEAISNGDFEDGNVGWEGDNNSCVIEAPIMDGAWLGFMGLIDTTEGIFQDIYLPGNATNVALSFDYIYDHDEDLNDGYGFVGLFNGTDFSEGSGLFFAEDDTGGSVVPYNIDITSSKGKDLKLLYMVDNDVIGSPLNILLVDNVSVLITTPNPYSVYSLKNKKSGVYYYTTSSSYKNTLMASGWSYKGVAYKAFKTSQTGLSKIYALKNKKSGVYYYTRSASYKNTLMNSGWVYKGVPFYGYSSYKDNNQPVYSLRNKAGRYYYTTSKSYKNTLVSSGWAYKGVPFYMPR